MPAYESACDTCGAFDLHLNLSEASAVASCPHCGSQARRVYSVPGVISISKTEKSARLRNERGAEPKVLRGQAR